MNHNRKCIFCFLILINIGCNAMVDDLKRGGAPPSSDEQETSDCPDSDCFLTKDMDIDGTDSHSDNSADVSSDGDTDTLTDSSNDATTDIQTENATDNPIDNSTDEESESDTGTDVDSGGDVDTDNDVDMDVDTDIDTTDSEEAEDTDKEKRCPVGQGSHNICLVSGTLEPLSSMDNRSNETEYVLRQQTLLQNERICGGEYCITGGIRP